MKDVSVNKNPEEKLPYAACERTLDFIIGSDSSNDNIRYRTTFFESHIENILASSRFGFRQLGMPIKRLEGFSRESAKDSLGINIIYARMPLEKECNIEEKNDYQKLAEKVEFAYGVNRASLKKGEYTVAFTYAGDKSIAVKAIEDAYASFRNLVERSGKTMKRPLKLEVGMGAITASFGTKEDGFTLLYEMVFQYEILINFLHLSKAAKNRANKL